MSAHKHTPGPWAWKSFPDDGGFCVYMADAIHNFSGYQVQHRIEMDFTLYPEDGAQWEEAKANTRLIAAAPEYFDGTADLLAYEEAVEAGDDERAMLLYASAIRKLRAAQTKATGAQA